MAFSTKIKGDHHLQVYDASGSLIRSPVDSWQLRAQAALRAGQLLAPAAPLALRGGRAGGRRLWGGRLCFGVGVKKPGVHGEKSM